MAVKGFLNSTSHPISHIVIKSHPSGGLGGLSSLQVLRVWSPAGPVASAPPENELAMQILRPRPGTCPIRKSRSRAQQSGFWHSLRGGSDTSWHLRSPCPACVQWERVRGKQRIRYTQKVEKMDGALLRMWKDRQASRVGLWSRGQCLVRSHGQRSGEEQC